MSPDTVNCNPTYHATLNDFVALNPNLVSWPKQANLTILTENYQALKERLEDKTQSRQLIETLTDFFDKTCPSCKTSGEVSKAVTELNNQLNGACDLRLQYSFNIFTCHHQACSDNECSKLNKSLQNLKPYDKTETIETLKQINTILVLFFGYPKKCHKIEFFSPRGNTLAEPLAAGLPNNRSRICFYNSALQLINTLFRQIHYYPQNQTRIPSYIAQKMLRLAVKTKQDDGVSSTSSNTESANQDHTPNLITILSQLEFSGIDFTKADCNAQVSGIAQAVFESSSAEVDLKKLTQCIIHYFKFLQAAGELFETLSRGAQASKKQVGKAQALLLSSFQSYTDGIREEVLQQEQSSILKAVRFLPVRYTITQQGDAIDILFHLLNGFGLKNCSQFCFNRKYVCHFKIYERGKSDSFKLQDCPETLPGAHETIISDYLILDPDDSDHVDEAKLTLDTYLSESLLPEIVDEENTATFFSKASDEKTKDTAVCQIEENETGVLVKSLKYILKDNTIPDCMIIQLHTVKYGLSEVVTTSVILNDTEKKISRSAVALMNAIRSNLVVKIPFCRTEKCEPEDVSYQIKSICCRSGSTSRSGHYTYLEFREDGNVVHINDSSVKIVGSTSDKGNLLDWVFTNNITPYLFLLKRSSSMMEIRGSVA